MLTKVWYNTKCIILPHFYFWGDNVNNKKDDNYISIDEAAEYLGIKTVTLRNWIKTNDTLPAKKVGKMWKFKKSELDAWVNSGKSAIE